MKEKKTIISTMLINAVVAIAKLTTGILFSFSTLIADSIQSFIDLFTDFTSLIANKIGKRRANKTYPFGYGQVYYLSNLLTGILLLLIGIFIIFHTFTTNDDFRPNLTILLILIFVLALKMIVIIILKHHGRISKNELLIESYKESKADFISTCVVIGVLIVSYFEEYIPDYLNVDKIGSICMAIYILFVAIRIIISNIRGIMINDAENEELKEEIIKELSRFKKLKFAKIKVIKMSNYYSVFLQIDVKNNTKVGDFIRTEKRIKRHLKSNNKSIRFIDIEPI